MVTEPLTPTNTTPSPGKNLHRSPPRRVNHRGDRLKALTGCDQLARHRAPGNAAFPAESQNLASLRSTPPFGSLGILSSLPLQLLPLSTRLGMSEDIPCLLARSSPVVYDQLRKTPQVRGELFVNNFEGSSPTDVRRQRSDIIMLVLLGESEDELMTRECGLHLGDHVWVERK